jgi:hypothetical protein
MKLGVTLIVVLRMLEPGHTVKDSKEGLARGGTGGCCTYYY